MSKIQKQVCDIRAGKGMSVAQSNEHLRIASKGAYESNVAGTLDPTRSALNFEVRKGGLIKDVDPSKSIPRRIKEILSEGISRHLFPVCTGIYVRHRSVLLRADSARLFRRVHIGDYVYGDRALFLDYSI